MNTKPTLVVLAVLLLGAATHAQTSLSGLFRDLERVLPLKVSAPGTPGANAEASADWAKAVEELGEVLAKAEGTAAEPLVMFSMGNALYSADMLDESKATFDSLKARFPDHPLVNRVQDPERKKSAVDIAIEDVSLELSFRKQHAIKTLPIPELDMSEHVVLHLSQGDIELRFYKNVAPKHRENFIDLARKGFYDRTCCNRIVREVRADFGDPKTKDSPPNEWGQGDPGYNLEHEFSRLSHKRGTVTMAWTPRRTRSHGSQFQIFLKDQPHVDFVQTPFAEVVKGLEIIDKLASGTKNQYDQPVEKCFINGISILKN